MRSELWCCHAFKHYYYVEQNLLAFTGEHTVGSYYYSSSDYIDCAVVFDPDTKENKSRMFYKQKQ